MVSTIDAPARMRGRPQAVALLAELPDDLTSATVQLRVPDEAMATASFLDQIVGSVLRDRGAACLVILTSSSLVQELAQHSAQSLGVSDRLSVVHG